MSDPKGGLIRSRRFWPLFTLIQTATFNDNALKNALIGLLSFTLAQSTIDDVVTVFQLLPFTGNLGPGSDGSELVPFFTFIYTFPFLLVCAIAGQIADKVDRAKIFKTIKFAEIWFMVLAAIGFWTMNIWILALSLFLMGAQSAFVSPTKNAVLPQWLREKELITGNALVSGFVFVFVLIGMIMGLFMSGMEHGPKIIAVVLLVFAIIGWLASRYQPEAPPPKPDMKVNFEPVTATFSVLAKAWHSPRVLRPMLGIAWYYGLSNVFIIMLPGYLKTVMGYDLGVLIVTLVAATLGILFGALSCSFLTKSDRWGKEALGLSALGICGVTLFTLDIFLFGTTTSVAPSLDELKGVDVFFAQPSAWRFLGDLVLASYCGGLFVVPLQAMAQRRADPAIRARLMSAGAVLLNLAVNIVNVVLIILLGKNLPPKSPFLIIIIGSAIVASYAVYRAFNPHNYESHVGEG